MRTILIWIAGAVAFVVLQRLVPGVLGVWLGVMALGAAYYWSYRIRVSLTDALVWGGIGLVVGWTIDFAIRHGSKEANELSILFMAMVFGACNAYLLARWWTRRRNRPLP